MQKNDSINRIINHISKGLKESAFFNAMEDENDDYEWIDYVFELDELFKTKEE